MVEELYHEFFGHLLHFRHFAEHFRRHTESRFWSEANLGENDYFAFMTMIPQMKKNDRVDNFDRSCTVKST